MRILLLSTYEMGRQPFGLASPTAWLRNAGHSVQIADLSRDGLPEDSVKSADRIALYVPMHTATVLAHRLLPKLRAINSTVPIAAYGLYAGMLKGQVDAVLAGEFEQGLVNWTAGEPADQVSMARQQFLIPDRVDLPASERYAQLQGRTAGYTEASRGCKHLCRHCPIVPVYQGTFRVVQRDVVLADIAQQVAGGATHITFGDPDFFNGPGHAIQLVEELHRRFPDVTYDVTIKVEHLLLHRQLLPILKRTGCAFVTSAVESLDDSVLERLAKGHTRADFFRVVELMRDLELPLSPTFVSFTPWTTRAAYCDLMATVAAMGLVENIAPVQYSIRLLIPAGSLLLGSLTVELYDPERFVYPWQHPDSEMDLLAAEIALIVQGQGSRRDLFERVWCAANQRRFDLVLPDRATIPYLNEPWYC